MRRRIILPMVLFPLPLSPIKETTSPSGMSKLTSLTAWSSLPPKVPTRYTFEIPLSVSMPIQLLPTGHKMTFLKFNKRRFLAALLTGDRAAVPEPAANRRVEQQRRAAGDAGEALFGEAHAHFRQRGNQQPGIGVPGRLDDLAGGRFFGQLPGVHDHNRVGDLVKNGNIV